MQDPKIAPADFSPSDAFFENRCGARYRILHEGWLPSGPASSATIPRMTKHAAPDAFALKGFISFHPEDESLPGDPDLIVVKPESAAWINADTLEETSFHWQDLVPNR